MIVQVNGKLRGRIQVAIDTDEETVVKIAREEPSVAKFLGGMIEKKAIVVPQKIVNLVMVPER